MYKKLIAAKIIIMIVLLSFLCGSCGTPTNICKQDKIERVNGEILYIYRSNTYNCRTIVLKTKNDKCLPIYNVPMEQPLKDIPTCKYKGKYYWVMP
jgi:hypothetical protein